MATSAPEVRGVSRARRYAATLLAVDAITLPFPLELTAQCALISFAEAGAAARTGRDLGDTIAGCFGQAEAHLNGIVCGLMDPA